jgi:hypothetical protein
MGKLVQATKVSCFVCFLVPASACVVSAQDNTNNLRDAGKPPVEATPNSNDPSKLPKIEGTESAKGDSKSKSREPIVLPTLSVPDTSLKGVGTGSKPEDFVTGRLPPSIVLPFGPERYGPWAIGTKTWIAPVFCHQPTYFEDTMLESHGHERFPCAQPLASGVRFYSTVAILPYLSYLNPPLQYSHSYDHYRPGSAAPALRQRPPYDKGALRFQLLTTGTAVLIAQP